MRNFALSDPDVRPTRRSHDDRRQESQRFRIMPQTSDANDRFVRAIAADRNFDAAVTSYLEAFVAWRRGLGGFNKVISSGARRRIMKSILCLHFGNATENPDDGATFERLLNQSSQRGGVRTARSAHRHFAGQSLRAFAGAAWLVRPPAEDPSPDRQVDCAGSRAARGGACRASACWRRTARVLRLRPRGAALVGKLAVLAGRNDGSAWVFSGRA